MSIIEVVRRVASDIIKRIQSLEEQIADTSHLLSFSAPATNEKSLPRLPAEMPMGILK